MLFRTLNDALKRTLINTENGGGNQCHHKCKSVSTGFTYIEILIALAIVAVLFIPMMQLFSHAIYSVMVSGEDITAVNLLRWEMEKVKNLNLTKAGIKKIGDLWTPKLDEPPLEMNNSKWRVLRRVSSGGDKSGTDTGNGPLEVRIEVYRADNLNKPVASAATLIEDNIWI
jgi:prepilin-type N-terminal cleavage/methylation domain-containing protein